MTQASDAVREHYQATIDDRGALLARIDQALDTMEPPLTAAKLARIDQFHFGGLAATAELGRRVRPAPDARVLDAGSGLGGPSRYLAETYGCHVEGVDLAPDYVAIATLLTERAGLSEHVRSRVGDLLNLPFDDAAFDLVWTQHVVMNIAERSRLYAELRRVLRPGGRFAFFDPIAGDGGDPHYPVPWAATPATSTLLTEAETIAELRRAKLHVAAFDDVTDMAIGWASQQPSIADPSGPSTAMIVGPRMGEMVGNFMRNLKEGRVRLAMGVCEAA